jgi:hypothetical protein
MASLPINDSVQRDLKIYCAEEGINQKDAATELAKKLLDGEVTLDL